MTNHLPQNQPQVMAETLEAQFVCTQRMKQKENSWNKKGDLTRCWQMFMRRTHLKAMIESLKQYQTTTKVWERCSLFYSMFFLLLWRSPLVFLWINPILDCISEFDSNTGKKSCTSSCTPKTVRNEMHSLHQVVCNLFLFRGIYSSSTL